MKSIALVPLAALVDEAGTELLGGEGTVQFGEPPAGEAGVCDVRVVRGTDGRPELDPARFDHVAYAEAVAAASAVACARDPAMS